MKKALWVVPLAVISAALLPLGLDGWHSACGCVSPKVAFEMYVRGNGDSSLNEQLVTESFASKFPVGTPVSEVAESYMVYKKECELQPSGPYVCSFWLESNSKNERGYEVSFALNTDNKVAGVTARKIQR